MYAITRITGQVGGAVARALLAARLPVRAVVRAAGKGVTWAERGCEVAIADMNDAPWRSLPPSLEPRASSS